MEDPTNRASEAIAALLRGVFQGRFPVGSRLTEHEVAQALGMSRTPVREALVELKGLGLLELRRNRGAVVRGISREKLREIYEVRRLLEVEATRRATRLMDRAELAMLLSETEALLDSGLDDQDWTLDQRLHRAIALACGNQTLVHEIDRYSTLIQAMRVTVGSRMPVQRLTTEQHLEILRAMAAKRPKAAADAMRHHLEQAEASALSALGT